VHYYSALSPRLNLPYLTNVTWYCKYCACVYICTASYARTLHCITVVHYDVGGALLLTSDELSLRGSTGQSDVIQRAPYIITVISATDLLASQLSEEQLIYVANSLCVVCTSQKNEIPAIPMNYQQIYHSCQLASHQLTRYVRCVV